MLAGSDESMRFIPAEVWLNAGASPADDRRDSGTDAINVPASQWLQMEFAKQASEQPLAMSTAVTNVTPVQRAPQVQSGNLDTQRQVAEKKRPSEGPSARQENQLQASPSSVPATWTSQTESTSGVKESEVAPPQHPHSGKARPWLERTSDVQSSVGADSSQTDAEPSATITAGRAATMSDMQPQESEDTTDFTTGKGDEGQLPGGRPAVGQISLERVEPLPPSPVEHGSQSALVFPMCHDGLLLCSPSSCSEEPYAWVETFREEAGIASTATMPARRSRAASEEAAEALLAEVKRRKSEVPDIDEEEVFLEETVVVTASPRSAQMDVSESGGEGFEEGPSSLAEDSFHNTESRQSRGRSDQRLLYENSAEHRLSGSGQNRDLTASCDVSMEFQTASLSEDLVDGRPGFVSTPLSQSSAALSPRPRLSSLPSSDSAFPNTESTVGPLSLQSDSSSWMSAEEPFYSPDVTVQSSSGSSESSVYRTPQQSPRGRSGPSAALASAGVPKPAVSLSPPLGGGGKADDGGLGQPLEGQSSVLTAVAAAVGRRVVGDTQEMEAMREILKQEVCFICPIAFSLLSFCLCWSVCPPPSISLSVLVCVLV